MPFPGTPTVRASRFRRMPLSFKNMPKAIRASFTSAAGRRQFGLQLRNWIVWCGMARLMLPSEKAPTKDSVPADVE